MQAATASAADSVEPIVLSANLVLEADCAQVLPRLPEGAFELIYIDPPFNTGTARRHRRLSVARDDENGDRSGFGGHRYRSRAADGDTPAYGYEDSFDDYLGFLRPKLERARELLAPRARSTSTSTTARRTT
jgi:site-specific DNA-methyltransferase (adenine-specific)